VKKKFFSLTLILGVLLSFSCKKNEPTYNRGASPVEFYEVEPVVVSSVSEPGWVMRVNAGIYSRIADDTGEPTDQTDWLAALSLGERVMTGSVRRATYKGDRRQYDFIEIRRDTGAEGLALTTQIAVGGRLAVVTDEKANLFRTPRAIDVSGVILPRKNVVIYYPETENNGFVQVKGYNTEVRDFVRDNNNYVRLSALSRRDSDIQSSILLQTALSLSDTAQNKIRRDAMLEEVILTYADSVFFAEIEALLNPNNVSTVVTELFSFPLTIQGNNVEVRDAPDMVVGRIINHLSRGAEVTTTERTTVSYEFDRQSFRWYKITSPVEGWVWGAYLLQYNGNAVQ